MSTPQEVKLEWHAGDLDDDGHDIHAVIAAGAMVPYYIPTGDTFTVPLYLQALFTDTIEVDGILVVLGRLNGVD